jgi:thiosulfate reductase cytochrome b subunit
LLLLSAASAAAREIRCEGCHAGGPRLVFDLKTGRTWDIAIDLRARAVSAHAALSCRDCHTGRFDLFPHPPHARTTLTCMGCHPRQRHPERFDFLRIAREFAASPHGKHQGFACERCHDPHRLSQPPADPIARFALANVPCLDCHAGDAQGPLADPVRPDLESIHAQLPHTALHLERTACRHCHDRTPADPLSHALPPARATAKACTPCHGQPHLLPASGPAPIPAWLLQGSGSLPTFAPVGAIRMPLADLTGLGIAGAFILLLWRHRRRLSPAPGDPACTTPYWRRLGHAGLASCALMLLMSGWLIAWSVELGPVGLALLDRLHRQSGLLLLSLWLILWAGLVAAGGFKRVWASSRERRARSELWAYVQALLQIRPLPSHGGAFGPLQGRSYALVMGGLLPLLGASGLILLVPERTAGSWLKPTVLLVHHLAALALTLFVLVHAGLVLAGPRPGRAVARMFGFRG